MEHVGTGFLGSQSVQSGRYRPHGPLCCPGFWWLYSGPCTRSKGVTLAPIVSESIVSESIVIESIVIESIVIESIVGESIVGESIVGGESGAPNARQRRFSWFTGRRPE